MPSSSILYLQCPVNGVFRIYLKTHAGWPSSSGPFAFWGVFSLCSGHRRCVFPRSCRMEKERTKTNMNIFSFGPFLMNSVPRHKKRYHETSDFPHCNSIICLKPHLFTSIFRAGWCGSAEELFATEKMAAQGLGSKKIATTLGLPLSTTKVWLQRLRSGDDVVPRSVGRPHGAEAGLCLVFLAVVVSPLSICT